jgi:hypothetical protein
MLPSLITGETTAGVHVAGDMKVIDKPSWLNIPQNAHLNGWSANTEIDSSVVGNFAPPNPHIIFSGKFQLTSLPKHNQALSAVLAARSYEAQTVWFTTPSGSAVFVAGINYWACELSFTCMEGNVNDATRSVLQTVTSQVLNLWQTPAVGKTLH